jgi:heme/copper-type cytochrome/quinol oxidase subunit 3
VAAKVTDATPPVVRSTAAEDAAYEQRCAEDAHWTGGRLLIGIVIFAFAALGFAYFYLRSFNTDGLWRPNHVTAPTATGTAIFAVVLASAALNAFGLRRFRRGSLADWEVAGWTALSGGLLATGLQIWEFTELGWYPGSSGYASCFVGWGAMNAALLFGSTIWLETVLARSVRLRRALREDGGAVVSQLAPARLFRASLDEATYFWWFAAAINLIFWILFYVI